MFSAAAGLQHTAKPARDMTCERERHGKRAAETPVEVVHAIESHVIDLISMADEIDGELVQAAERVQVTFADVEINRF